jgi:hypothetical protein
MRRLLLLAVLLPLTATADTTSPDDVVPTPKSDKIKVLSDGKSHYIVIEPFAADAFEGFFYGDGKEFWQQRVIGGGSSGTESFDKAYWEPRGSGYHASLSFRNDKYTVDCDKRTTELTPLAADAAAKILGAAKFHKPRWKRQAYALARDNTGRYYYVDRMREPEGNKIFRLFVGPKGALKMQKMTNVVSDSAGDIFATKTGELRLVLNKGESLWQQQKKETKLISLPIDENHALIYAELGVYAGEKLGTPCDDL